MIGSIYMIMWSIRIIEIFIPSKNFNACYWIHPTNQNTIFCPWSWYFK